jgi:hypothetical protein
LVILRSGSAARETGAVAKIQQRTDFLFLLRLILCPEVAPVPRAEIVSTHSGLFKAVTLNRRRPDVDREGDLVCRFKQD